MAEDFVTDELDGLGRVNLAAFRYENGRNASCANVANIDSDAIFRDFNIPRFNSEKEHCASEDALQVFGRNYARYHAEVIAVFVGQDAFCFSRCMRLREIVGLDALNG